MEKITRKVKERKKWKIEVQLFAFLKMAWLQNGISNSHIRHLNYGSAAEQFISLE